VKFRPRDAVLPRRPGARSDFRPVCGRFTSSASGETLRERFQVTPPEGYRERYNVAPGQRVAIVRPADEGREAALVRWGLLPHWAKDAKIAYKLINARAETLAEKPAFRSLLGRYRCLVLADGFYEWRVGQDGGRDPLHFRLGDGSPFAFAGLWTSRTDPASGELVESCTIVTTAPNPLVAPVHDRMPVILPRGLEDEWLDPDISREHALSLLLPFEAAAMRALPASRRANSVRNDDPRLLVADEFLPAAAAA
jgi:putative SOS response-associated peptidase YedK